MIGRKDSSTPAPDESLLPSNASMSSTDILSLMADKGFSGPDVAALVGAHSTSRQFFADPSKAGQPQDSTPGIWDVAFYGQTSNPPPGVFVFHSDKALSQDPASGPTFKSFIGQQAYVRIFYPLTVVSANIGTDNGIKLLQTLSPASTFSVSRKTALSIAHPRYLHLVTASQAQPKPRQPLLLVSQGG
jgi:hypothetical protein